MSRPTITRPLAMFAVLAVLAVLTPALSADDTRLDLTTRWGSDLDPLRILPEYPRPQMQRDAWVNLNGPWDYAIVPRGTRPSVWDGEILVPFCVESTLSGVSRTVGPEQTLWYRRSFDPPLMAAGDRLLLHFGAVDWRCTAWVNGVCVGTHEGGYDPFTFDVTGAIDEASNELVIEVWDPTDAGHQPRGKQVREPGGIWYTAVTGIWQTVWLEPVPAASIAQLRLAPDLNDNTLWVDVETRGNARELVLVLEAEIDGERTVVEGRPGARLGLRPDRPIPRWSPDEPRMHPCTITLRDGTGRTIDQVRSAFGFRSIEFGPDERGVNRLLLNGEPHFHYGTLDQGWWPDGLYTAPTDEALRYDLEVTKRLGFNMVRKHVKIEPARWYHWCDHMGLMVWQDMPSGDAYIHGDMPDIERSAQSAVGFERELRAMIRAFGNHPSIVMWVPYNEGWGQWATEHVVKLVRDADPTRLVNAASGWTDRGNGDVHDIHRYPGPAMPPLEDDRAAVLGEFGGLGLPVPGHLWQEGGNWGYRTYQSTEALTDAYERLLEQLHVLIGRGLAAAVYTQTTDVEIEVNGLMTYDRAVIKLDEARAIEAARRLFDPPPVMETILPVTADSPELSRYTFEQPGPDWSEPGFDDAGWLEGRGGFGTEGTPGARVGTEWDTKFVWVRRTFELDAVPTEVELLLHHDEDVEISLNGVVVARRSGYVTDYVTVPMTVEPSQCLRVGTNVLAMRCVNTSGGQFIDAGLVVVRRPSADDH